MSVQVETERLYHSQPYLTEIDAWIDDVVVDDRGSPVATLSRTILYPQGGGQLGDRGMLSLPGDELLAAVPILTTKRNGADVAHHLQCTPDQLSALQGAVGRSEFKVRLDWCLRYQQMRLHSAAHLIHCMMERVKGEPIPHPMRSPLTETDGENQYESIEGIDETLVAEATALLNAFLADSHPISTRADEARGEGFRWWTCADWEIPCGGVHPLDAQEIGRIKSDFRIRKGTARVGFSLDQG